MQGLNLITAQLSFFAEKLLRFDRKVSRSALSFLLVFSFIFSQAVSLNHSHDGELSDQVDCEICLKVGSQDDLLTSDTSIPSIANAAIENSLALPAAQFIAATVASARAPPSA